MRYILIAFTTAILGLLLVAKAMADTPLAKIYQWTSSAEGGTAFALAPTRGETMVLQPRIISYGEPMDLTHVYTVTLLYKAVGDTKVYSIPGSVLDPIDGRLQIGWTSAHELAAKTYAYDILVSGATSTFVAARGAITFRDGVSAGATLATNSPIYVLDFDQVQLLNVGNAPFLSSYEINDIRSFLESIQAGIGDIDCSNLTVRGTLAYTNWPAYLARTNQISLPRSVAAGANISVTTTTNSGIIVYTVTGAAGGGSGGGGIGSYTNTSINGIANTSKVDIADGDNISWAIGTDGVWRASAGIPASWASTGTLYWVVDGVTIGRVDTNGITMLKGSLSLYEEDLTCNVRLYDGSRISPSLTLQGHPGTWGLFGRGYNGSYSAAWSQNGTEIGILSGLGITLSTSNAAFTGRLVGDLSGSTGYPEPLWASWYTNRSLPDLTITNSGLITVKDAGGTTRFSVDGSSGATTIRGQDSDSRYVKTGYNTNWPSFIMTNLYAGKTSVLWYVNGVVTNRTQL